MNDEDIRNIRLGDIKYHPLNSFFFDDIPAGEKWEDFKASVRDGLISRPILTHDLFLVSGHQRIRAKRENGDSEDTLVSCVIRRYQNEEEIMRDMIDTNIQQRGTLACSPVKMGRIAMALESIFNIRRGGDRKSDDEKIKHSNAVFDLGGKDDTQGAMTQSSIHAMLNQNRETYRVNKRLAQMPPEFQEMVERGQITPSIAARLICRMDEAAQEKLLVLLPNDVKRKFTQAEIQGFIDQIKALEDHLTVAQTAISGGADEWVKLAHEKNQAEEKARREYEASQRLKKSMRASERQMEKLQAQWEIAEARADGSMFDNSPFSLLDSAINGYLRGLEFFRHSESSRAQLNEDQMKYITSLFAKAAQLTNEVRQALRTPTSVL